MNITHVVFFSLSGEMGKFLIRSSQPGDTNVKEGCYGEATRQVRIFTRFTAEWALVGLFLHIWAPAEAPSFLAITKMPQQTSRRATTGQPQ